MQQRHYVLQLVAVTERSAGLVESRSPPDSTGQGLIEQPAVEQNIQPLVGGLHLDGIQQAVPLARNGIPGAFQVGDGLEALDQFHRSGAVLTLAKQVSHFLGFSRSKPEQYLHGSAGVRAGQHTGAQAHAVERCRPAVASQ